MNRRLSNLSKWLLLSGYAKEGSEVLYLSKQAINKLVEKNIKDWLQGDYSKLSFDDLFNGKLRISIPLETEQKDKLPKILLPLIRAGWKPAGSGQLFDVRKVQHKVRGEGGVERFEEIDVADFKIAREVKKIIPSGPRAGEEVVSTKVISLSKAIQRNSSEEDFRWWQKNETKYSTDYNWKQVEAVFDDDANLEGQSIVISRDPIDVVRMSDHKRISSCHSPDGSYFECAMAEAKGTGLIAYLVDNSDLEKLLTSDVPIEDGTSEAAKRERRSRLGDFYGKEMFADPDRGVKGIIPKSRVRLRKYVNKFSGDEFAAPESRTYGPHPPGFVDAVRRWAWNAQKDIFGEEGELNEDDLPEMSDLEMHGGSYRDTNDATILTEFFEEGGFATYYTGNAETVSENEATTMDLWEQEIEEVMTRARTELKYVSFFAEVEGEDNNPYISTSAFLTYDIDYELPENPERQMPEGRAWEWEVSDKNNFFSYFEHPAYGSVDEVSIDPELKRITVGLTFNCEDCNNPDEVSAFFQHILSDVDRGHPEYLEKVRQTLVREGYTAEIEFDRADLRLEKTKLENFNYIGTDKESFDGEILISLKPEESIRIESNIIPADELPSVLGSTPDPSVRNKHILSDEYKSAALSVLQKISEESLRQLHLDFGDGWAPPPPEQFSIERVAKNFNITASVYAGPPGTESSAANIYFSMKLYVGDDPDHIKFIEKFVHNVDQNFPEIKAAVQNVLNDKRVEGEAKKKVELNSFDSGEKTKPLIEKLKNSGQPDVIRLALWVEKNWDNFSKAEKEVAHNNFLVPTINDGDYIHPAGREAPKFWDGIMQRRPDTDFNYKWQGISMLDVMPYSTPGAPPGQDPNYGSEGVWVDEYGKIRPPTVAQLEKLFIK